MSRTSRLMLPIAMLVAAAAPAQVDFVAINIALNPDTLYHLDITNPAAAAIAPPLATLSGNFIRGMELTAEKTGWYVATSATSGSPTGYFQAYVIGPTVPALKLTNLASATIQ